MRGLGHPQPACAVQFLGAGQLADAGTEDLRTAAGQRAKARLFQFLQRVINRLARQIRQMLNLHAGEGLNVDIRPHCFNAAQCLKVIGIRQVRMNATDHVNLGYWFIQPLPHLVLDLFDAHLIRQLMAFLLAKGAELTEIGADIGIVDVLIVDKEGLVAVLALADTIGQPADGQQIRAFIQPPTVVLRKPFRCVDFDKDVAETGLFDEGFHGIR